MLRRMRQVSPYLVIGSFVTALVVTYAVDWMSSDEWEHDVRAGLIPVQNQLPRLSDDGEMLAKSVELVDDEIVFQIEYINHSASEIKATISHSEYESFESFMREQVVSGVRENEFLCNAIAEYNLTYRNVYRGSDGILVGVVTVREEDLN